MCRNPLDNHLLTLVIFLNQIGQTLSGGGTGWVAPLPRNIGRQQVLRFLPCNYHVVVLGVDRSYCIASRNDACSIPHSATSSPPSPRCIVEHKIEFSVTRQNFDLVRGYFQGRTGLPMCLSQRQSQEVGVLNGYLAPRQAAADNQVGKKS